MDHPQRSIPADASNATSSSNLMPSVLFREIHKNAFLKRHSSDRRAGFPRKSERVWVVFCVHDDIEPYLEIYPDQKVALTHKPEWFASLSNVLHVSPTICGHEDEYEFAITLSFQVVRLSAPSWDSMMEWVETIRNKLRELKVLCPKENIYSKMPEQKQPLLPTRDPNSPLPLPPEGPLVLMPGVELVHLENRNTPAVTNAQENGRHLRVSHSRSNDQDRRNVNKRVNVSERNHVSSEASQSSESQNRVNINENNLSEPSTSGCNAQANKVKVKKAVSAPKSINPATNIPMSSNITVIEVSTSSVSSSIVSEPNVETNQNNMEGSEILSSHALKILPAESNNEDGVHYEHVFLPSVPVIKQPSECKASVSCIAVNGNKSKRLHSTSLLISSNDSNQLNPSQDENLPSTSSTCLPINSKNSVSNNVSLITKKPLPDECSDKSPLSSQVQSKLEKVSISGLIPRVPAKSQKAPFKQPSQLFKDSNTDLCEIKRATNVDEVNNGDTNKAGTSGISVPVYSQVKKIPKGKTKAEDGRKEDILSNQIRGSPVFPRRKVPEIPVTETESHSSSKMENVVRKNPTGMSEVKVLNNIDGKVVGSRKPEPSCSGVSVEVTKNTPFSSNNEIRNGDVPISGPSSSVHNAQINLSRKESFNGSNSKPEVEPIIAVVQPPVGVISVEDIPLIGGHQRRRRRSSSSDAVPAANASSSRGIGGADRIRINVPNNVGREPRRNESEMRPNHIRSTAESNPSVEIPSSILTLREKQVLQLKKEMLHPGGVRLQLRRKDCTGSIAFVDVLNGVWIAGWKQKEHPLLYNALHIGDQLISIGDALVRNSAEAHKIIRSSTSLYIEFIIRRVPFGNVFALQRSSEGQSLGIVQEGNTAEIKDVVPNSIAARQGLTAKTPSCDGLSLTTWFLTEINGRPLNLFFKDNEVRDRLNAVGKEISILVQPHDFIKQIKKQLKNIRSYKDYIVQ